MKIVSKNKKGKMPTWDIHVPGKEHYITKNGCVSHNTSQILSNNECFEPVTSNLYKRGTMAGEFPIINRYLVNDLDELGLWDEDMKYTIMAHKGSIQNIPNIPQSIKDKYRTAWEISQKAIIDQAADRGIYICQTQSMNLFLQSPTERKVGSMHMYAWKKGLKTGLYYLRSKAAVDAVQFTVDKKYTQKTKEELEREAAQQACSLENPGSCEMCSG